MNEKKTSFSDFAKAHEFSNNNRLALVKDEKCGCFYCLQVFHPQEIKEWLTDNNLCDQDGTAICPYCGTDSVIGESSGFPITEKFLKRMHDYWF